MHLEDRAREILEIQRDAISKLSISSEMVAAAKKIASMRDASKIIVTTGMGKAGIIATKMSATLASLGLPSFFVSPAEAGHGDLGRVSPGDLVIVFSNSGSTTEVASMIDHLHLLNKGSNFVITICSTGKPAVKSDLVINYGTVVESCVVSKVPSTSTTVMLVLADVLAITAAESIGLDDSWFKARHPGGAIGAAYRGKDTR